MVVENDDLPMCSELGLSMVAPIGRFCFASEKIFEDAYCKCIIGIRMAGYSFEFSS